MKCEINNPLNEDWKKILQENKNKSKKTLDEQLKEDFEKYKYLYPEKIEVVEYKDRVREVRLK